VSPPAAGPDTTTVTIDRSFDTTVPRLWRMFTDPDEVAVWGCGDWYDHIAIDLDLRVGGVLHHRVSGRDDGTPWTFRGVYLEIEPDRRLVYTFDWKTDWRQDPAPSTVTIRFDEGGDGRALLHLEHAEMPRAGEESTRRHWAAFLDKLTELL
jgi:uncharacterized protein YndB with AHSA1/START domain